MLSLTPSSSRGVQPDGLFVQRPPTDEEVAGRRAFEDALQLPLQVKRRGEAAVGPLLAAGAGVAAASDPVAQMAEGDRLQRTPALAVRAAQAVAVRQGVKAIPAAVP